MATKPSPQRPQPDRTPNRPEKPTYPDNRPIPNRDFPVDQPGKEIHVEPTDPWPRRKK